MCGLFSLARTGQQVRENFSYAELADFPPRAYVAPGGPMAIIRAEAGTRHFALTRWGFIPGWAKEPKPGKPLINARSETVVDKPSFRSAIRRRRCLIPADGWFEWQGDQPGRKQPFKVSHHDGAVFAMAGIWEHWLAADGSEIETAAILTTAANDRLAVIHHRMPVTIAPADYDRWLDCSSDRVETITDLMQPAPNDMFDAVETVIERRPSKPKPPPIKVVEPQAQLKLF